MTRRPQSDEDALDDTCDVTGCYRGWIVEAVENGTRRYLCRVHAPDAAHEVPDQHYGIPPRGLPHC